LFLTSALLFLTPVLKSLTISYSEDTIILLVISKERFILWYDCIVFIIFHLFTHDYKAVKKSVNFDNITKSMVSSPVSVNSIFFATILLASRLEKV
jgi:hypothetical protein